MSYKDKTFCPKSDKDNPKCVQCERFFDKEEYDRVCAKEGFEIPVCWFLEPSCEDTDIINLKEEDKK